LDGSINSSRDNLDSIDNSGSIDNFIDGSLDKLGSLDSSINNFADNSRDNLGSINNFGSEASSRALGKGKGSY
jgi:hypothetical protein